jgi:hypothetical protein
MLREESTNPIRWGGFRAWFLGNRRPPRDRLTWSLSESFSATLKKGLMKVRKGAIR